MVSNAVPWSRVSPCGKNLNPGAEEVRCAARFWEDLLPVLRSCAGAVTLVLASGKTAERVVQRAAPTAPMLALLGPFSLNRARLRDEEKQLSSPMRAAMRAFLDSVVAGHHGFRTPGDLELAYLCAASALWRWQGRVRD
jgi:hypothetical protein